MGIKEYMEENKITVKRAAVELELSRQYLYDLKDGKACPSRKLAVKIEAWSGGIIKKEGLLFGESTSA
jgi:DNA-binding XRE family transcriptional regulator